MHIVPIAECEVRKRQRTTINASQLSELKEKVARHGLLHPPVFWHDKSSGKWVLNAGERRFRVIQDLHREGRELRCDGQLIQRDYIPITRLDDLIDEIGKFETELDENVLREELTWQDRVRAYADLHKMRQITNPTQSLRQTGDELVARGVESSAKAAEGEISQAVIIAQHLDNDKIAQARNPAEAAALIYKQEEEKIMSVLVARRLARIPDSPTIKLRQGDLTKVLPGLESDIADLILVDPPYGLGASSGGFRQRTVHHHNYEDTPENAKEIAKCVLSEGFRICKARANLFMFCDIELFDWLKTASANMGWSPFRRPFIWRKSQSEGLAPWGGSGPRITTEFIFYATKGRRGLLTSPVDVLEVPRVSRAERLHAAEKPVELLKQIITFSTLPGDFVFDPCCGSGSTLVAAKETKRQALGIELDKDYFNTAMANVFGGEVNAEAQRS